MFAHSAEDIEKQNKLQEKRAIQRKARRKEADAEDVDSSSDSDADSYERHDALSIDEMRATAQRKKTKEFKPKGPADVLGDSIRNLNNGVKKSMKLSDLGQDGKPREALSRREREAIEAAKRKAAYMEKHRRGETDQAKKDLARLAAIRKRREEEARRREEVNAAKSKGKRRKDEDSDSEEEIASLTNREIKKMNPTKLKAELKLRNQPTQGNKKALQNRLLDWCVENQK